MLPTTVLAPAQAPGLAPAQAPAQAPAGAPSRRRIGLNPDLARVALAGALLFGAMVATLGKPQVVHDPPAPPAPTGQHAGPAPTRR